MRKGIDDLMTLLASCSHRSLMPTALDARVVRNGTTVWTGPIGSMRHFKDEVAKVFEYTSESVLSLQVNKGTECGIVLSGWSDVQIGDIIESVEVQSKKRSLDDAAQTNT